MIAFFVANTKLRLAHGTLDITVVLAVTNFLEGQFEPTCYRIINRKKFSVFGTSCNNVA